MNAFLIGELKSETQNKERREYSRSFESFFLKSEQHNMKYMKMIWTKMEAVNNKNLRLLIIDCF